MSTHFLPDRDREVAEAKERELLKEKYIAEQERIKNEKLEITFSYWDGGGHRRKVEILKGDTVGQFLGKARDKLSKEFRELRHTSTDGLMYIKEDLILPHTATFYDFIVNKARGKSGPLFHFDVHDDVRIMGGGAGVEKDRVSRRQGHPPDVVRQEQTHFPRLEMGAVGSAKGLRPVQSLRRREGLRSRVRGRRLEGNLKD